MLTDLWVRNIQRAWGVVVGGAQSLGSVWKTQKQELLEDEELESSEVLLTHLLEVDIGCWLGP